jgi:Fe-S cluster assembly ATP-binding protein
MNKLKIKNLTVHVKTKKVLDNLNLKINKGTINVLMGPNGCGKSTLIKTITGHPKYRSTFGKILLKNKEITDLKPDEISNLGIFAIFQNSIEIPGVSFMSFLNFAMKSQANFKKKELKFSKFYKKYCSIFKKLKIDKKIGLEPFNIGRSGGEKKKLEIAQMLMFKPSYILIDEVDSGLDIDSLKLVSKSIQDIFLKNNPGILIITHYLEFLKNFKINNMYVMKKGQILIKENKSNKIDKIIKQIKYKGYKSIL